MSLKNRKHYGYYRYWILVVILNLSGCYIKPNKGATDETIGVI
jgi:hypothetical protein